MRRKVGNEAEWEEPCGCVITATRYVKMCRPHEKEFKEIHDRWTADKIRMDKENDERERAIKEIDK